VGRLLFFPKGQNLAELGQWDKRIHGSLYLNDWVGQHGALGVVFVSA
jgi:hypothetical protein